MYVCLMLFQHCGHWASIKPELTKRIVFAGNYNVNYAITFKAVFIICYVILFELLIWAKAQIIPLTQKTVFFLLIWAKAQIIPLTQKTVFILLFFFYGISPGLFLLQFFRYHNETSQ